MIGLLCLLWLVDAMFIGFRDAAGRNPAIRKWDGYYQRGLVRGLAGGLVGLVLIGAVATGGWAVANDRDAVLAAYTAGARPMLWVYGTYATLVIVALGLWLSKQLDVRTLASVLVLGPFTLIRPLVVLAGLLAALAVSPGPEVSVSAMVTLLVANGLEPLLNLAWRRGLHRDARALELPGRGALAQRR